MNDEEAREPSDPGGVEPTVPWEGASAAPRLERRSGYSVLELLQAWVDRACEDPRTLHHRGRGAFMVAGQTVRLASRVR